MMTPDQKRFLDDELFSLTLQAAVQRSPTYSEGVSDKRKAEFKEGLRSELTRLAEIYKLRRENPVTSKEHMEHIEELAGTLTSKFGDCLLRGRFRIGSAQKALNLYLKYLWCLDEVGPPPHCPFDYEIIKRLDLPAVVNWTDLDDIDIYRTVAEQAAAAAQQERADSIAQWELVAYNSVRN